MIRILAVSLALLAPFLFPWPLALALALAAGYFFPPIVLVVGALAELLYGAGSLPYVFLGSVVGFLVMASVRHIVKARIMGV